MLEVCCAIILKEDKVLAVQRGPESSHPFLWEFPGGKIQANETAIQCIIREIQEELKVEIEVLNEFSSVEYNYVTKQIHLIPFVCRIISGEIYLTEHLAKQWFTFKAWKSIDWAEADRQLIIENEDRLNLLFRNENLTE